MYLTGVMQYSRLKLKLISEFEANWMTLNEA